MPCHFNYPFSHFGNKEKITEERRKYQKEIQDIDMKNRGMTYHVFFFLFLIGV
jgi:hypothetical protein